MNRRAFVGALGGAAVVWPPLARAQQTRLRQMGAVLLIGENDPDALPRVAAFEAGLSQLGWVSGRDIHIEYRWPKPDSNMLLEAKAMVAIRPEVILATGTPMVAALKSESQDIPVVFVQVADPVGSGLVAGLAQPGGNITGFLNYEFSIGGKWLEILKEIAPDIAHVTFLINPGNAAWNGFFASIEAAATRVGIGITAEPVKDASDIRNVILASARPSSGLIIQPDQVTIAHRGLISRLAAENRLPTVYPFRSFTVSGGLVSYGIDVPDVYRRAAAYVDRILRGEKPSNLPVQAPTKFQLVVNLKAASALNLAVPATLLALVDEVIE